MFNRPGDSSGRPILPLGMGGFAFPAGARRRLPWIGLGIVAILVFVSFALLRGLYTDWLWFRALNYSSVFITILSARVWLFLAGAAAFAVLAIPNIYLAFRFSRGASSSSISASTAGQLRPIAFWIATVIISLLSIVFGVILSGQWETVLLYSNASTFGTADPVFSKDIGFYTFILPLLNSIHGWLLAAIIILSAATGAIYFALFSIRGLRVQITTQIKCHLSILGALFFLIMSWGYWLDLFELLFSSGGAAFGATYTDVHARIPALWISIAIAAGAALLLIGNVFVRGTRLAIAAVALWLGAVILVGAIYPAGIQRFRVEPNELSLERQFISRNISATRQAYGLENISVQHYPAAEDLSLETIQSHPGIMNNIRVWSHDPLRSLYNQKQFIRPYYDFLDVDVDRYTVDGEYRQVMLGVRHLSPEKLPEDAQSWVNQTLQWTHGYGVAASPVNTFTPEGHPYYFLQDVPPVGKFLIERPEVYYGEKSREFVIVNTDAQEVDYPTDDGPVYTRYQGNGGVPLDSFIDRMLFAWEFGDFNILISEQITPESRIQFRRHIQERIEVLAPFLQLDKDPYIVVADGRLSWVQDAYTVTDRYPYSTPYDESGFNYIRNSVKVVVDAYDGMVTFYVADPTDPILQAYSGIFPQMFTALEDMPNSLSTHIRYPHDLFYTQAQLYLTYHMTDETVFYNREDQWSIPQEQLFGERREIEPYHLISSLAGSDQDEFLLILPFTPVERPNMVAWLAARNDPPHYGELILFNFPRGRQIDGPAQVEARIDNDAEISQQFTLWGQVGSTVIRGNLLVIPIGESVLYVEPVYLQAENLAFPELRRVIVANASQVTMKPTLGEAIAALYADAPTELFELTEQIESGSASSVPSVQSISDVGTDLEALANALSSIEQILINLEAALTQLGEQSEDE